MAVFVDGEQRRINAASEEAGSAEERKSLRHKYATRRSPPVTLVGERVRGGEPQCRHLTAFADEPEQVGATTPVRLASARASQRYQPAVMATSLQPWPLLIPG
ncbi:MAG: hypothetical protein M5U28_56075 [Sandaracinaceae bacterium]|nr:hypothetical protein [Sandaracinaceae bacterium]